MKKIVTIISLALCLITFNSFAGVNEDLVTACKKGDLEAVKTTLAAGADANFIDAEGFSTLSHAFFWPEIVQLLIDKGADVSKGNMPPFVQATNFMSVEVMKLLLAKGADPKKGADYETTVDMGALYKKSLEAEKAKGDNANPAIIKAFEGLVNTPPTKTPVKIWALPNALKMGNKACIEVLSAANVKLNADEEIAAGTAAKIIQDFAMTAKSPDLFVSFLPATAKSLEDRGYKVPDWFKNMDKSKFMTVAEQLDYLLKAGFDVNKKYGADGRTALSYALDFYLAVPEENALVIIKAGGNVNEVDEKWGPLLNLAAKKGQINVMKAMVAAGADINAESKNPGILKFEGMTPLIMAALGDQAEVVNYLIQSGVKNSDGASGYILDVKAPCGGIVKNKTAIYFAIEHKNMTILKLLVETSGIDWKKSEATIKAIEQVVGRDAQFKYVKCSLKGKYSPLEFANSLFEKGELHSYLKSKGF